MPFIKRTVEPPKPCRGTLPDGVPVSNDLEAVINGTLANVIRQLSSLSRHAEDMFGELSREADSITSRSTKLQKRIDLLAERATRLDSTVEEEDAVISECAVSLQDIHMRKAFRSRVVYDQQVFSRSTMPAAMHETYMNCEKPPPLDKLNVYRDDGKDGLKFYTDPNYFFELWRQEMLRENDRLLHEKGKRHGIPADVCTEPHRPRTDPASSASSGGPGGSAGGSAGGGRPKSRRVRQEQNSRDKHRQLALESGEGLYNRHPAGGHISPSPPPPPPLTTDTHRLANGVADSPVSRFQSSSQSLSHLRHDVRHSSSQSSCVDGVTSSAISNSYNAGSHRNSAISTSSIYGYHQQAATSNGTLTRSVSTRPNQPPPAPPPSTVGANISPYLAAGYQQQYSTTRVRSSSNRDSLPPPPPPPSTTVSSSPAPPVSAVYGGARVVENGGVMVCGDSSMDELPPPPPVPDEFPPPPPPPLQSTHHIEAPPPPPPPPPLSPNGDVPCGDSASRINSPVRPAPLPDLTGDGVDGSVIESGAHPTEAPEQICDARSDLLKAIRDGIKLRKVEEVEGKRREESTPLLDVASILARRVAIEVSDSESDGESVSENWDEEPSPLAVGS